MTREPPCGRVGGSSRKATSRKGCGDGDGLSRWSSEHLSPGSEQQPMGARKPASGGTTLSRRAGHPPSQWSTWPCGWPTRQSLQMVYVIDVVLQEKRLGHWATALRAHVSRGDRVTFPRGDIPLRKHQWLQ